MKLLYKLLLITSLFLPSHQAFCAAGGEGSHLTIEEAENLNRKALNTFLKKVTDVESLEPVKSIFEQLDTLKTIAEKKTLTVGDQVEFNRIVGKINTILSDERIEYLKGIITAEIPDPAVKELEGCLERFHKENSSLTRISPPSEYGDSYSSLSKEGKKAFVIGIWLKEYMHFNMKIEEILKDVYGFQYINPIEGQIISLSGLKSTLEKVESLNPKEAYS